ncbi:hypothetical protein ANCCEY_01469 [Ancylostoma ceylanicum]|uniref:Uncharacterized protein n=1 Tax=Ancylostoma ceylanicum TaxID=53326 RepID=A0A0D6M5L0_9BILA|nr:hypothetical protein ANCCEY_01469 [Ancylostoma ceylanicum]
MPDFSGFDYLDESMQTIFYAQGPSFKTGAVLPPFQNVEYMNLWLGPRCQLDEQVHTAEPANRDAVVDVVTALLSENLREAYNESRALVELFHSNNTLARSQSPCLFVSSRYEFQCPGLSVPEGQELHSLSANPKKVALQLICTVCSSPAHPAGHQMDSHVEIHGAQE